MKAWLPNMVLFQFCWIAFVAGAGRGIAWAGFPALLVFAVWQIGTSAWPRADVALVAIAAVLGFAFDSAFVRAGLIDYPASAGWHGWAPPWIVGLWMAFALTLNHSLAFLKRKPLAAVVLGALGGPLAYWVAANAWHAATLVAPQSRALLALALAWGLATPVLAWIATRLAVRELEASTA